jgi:hypothetical protein
MQQNENNMTYEIVETEFALKRVNTIHGIELLNYDPTLLEEITDDVIEEWSADYHDDDGGDFGSSDMTFLIKNIVDDYIMVKSLPLETKFLPELTIIKK